MARKKTKKKKASGISEKTEKRIVEISLANPDFGARRLARLLAEEKIQLSTSAVYNILKRHGLQTRSKRIQKLEESKKDPLEAPKKFPGKIPPEVEDRIAALSLQHPDLGAKRLLPLLANEEIAVSASAVYRILKRRGLQTRPLRLAQLEAREPEPAEITPPAEEPIQKPEEIFFWPVPVETISPAKPLKKPVRRFQWVFALFNFMLVVLIVFLGVRAALNIIGFTEPPVTDVATAPAPDVVPEAQASVSRPLNDYRMIWERNLFNISEEKPPAPEKTIPVENIKLASSDLGLKLVGTVVADNANLSLAIIDSRKNREQMAFHEGDQTGKVRIKKIMRNKVIITTEKGDELLTLDPEKFAKNMSASSSKKGSTGRSSPSRQLALSRQPAIRRGAYNLSREDVSASLEDMEKFMQNMKVSPYTENDQPAGFRVTGITYQNILRKLGLRNGDIIMGINDEVITNPDQATDFLGKIREGGEINIKVKRRRRSRLVRLNIE